MVAEQMSSLAEASRGSEPTPPPAAPPRRKPTEITEDELLGALESNRWDLKAAAETLAIARPSLYMLLDRFPQLRQLRQLTAEQLTRCYRDCGGDLDAMVELLHISHSALRRRLRELHLA